jgi:type IV secretory pathway protease TraF
MDALGRVLIRALLTVAALLAVLLVFIVEPVMAPPAKAPTVLLLDRGRRLRVGDLARCTHPGGALVARVVASAGQRLALRGNLLFIDGEPVERRPCKKGEVGLDGSAPPDRCFVERRGDRSWFVIAPSEGQRIDLETQVPAGSVYLLSDDRAEQLIDSRGRGPFPREACRPIAAAVSAGAFRLRP